MESYIVRVWVPPDDDAELAGGLRGLVQHLSTGATRTFRTPEELLAALAAPEGSDGPTDAGDPA